MLPNLTFLPSLTLSLTLTSGLWGFLEGAVHHQQDTGVGIPEAEHTQQEATRVLDLQLPETVLPHPHPIMQL